MTLLVVGLTGNIGSGKSTVRRIFEELGERTLDADRVVHDLYRPGGGATRLLADEFGPEILAPDGGIDRARLAGRTMGNREATGRLERIVHPLVEEAIGAWIEETKGKAGSAPALAIIEASLTFEAGTAGRHDVMVVVDAPLELRRTRAAGRGISPAEFDRREARMMAADEKRRRGDFVLANEGDELRLRRDVRSLRETLLRRAERKSQAG